MTVRMRLFAMMVLQLAVWGAWAPKLFPYMGMLGFAPWQQSLVGSAWGVAALLGIFFSNQFADRNFSAEKLLAVLRLLPGFQPRLCADAFRLQRHRLRQPGRSGEELRRHPHGRDGRLD